MATGREEEARIIALEERRGLKRYGMGSGQRRFDVWLRSSELGLEGVVDMIIDSTAGPIPVDYKMVRFIGDHHRLQLAGYAILLETQNGVTVDRGFIYDLEHEKIEVVDVTSDLRRRLDDAVEAIRTMIRDERIPEPTDRIRKCEECEYRRFCNDVL